MLLELVRLALAHPCEHLTVLCWERLDAAHPHCHRTLLVEMLNEYSTPGKLTTHGTLPCKARGAKWVPVFEWRTNPVLGCSYDSDPRLTSLSSSLQ